MIEFSFPVPAKPWSTNQDRNLHHQERHKLVAAWKEATGWAWKIAGVRKCYCVGENHHLCSHLSPCIVHVTIPFTQDRKRDPHNYCGTVVKAIIDGLVEMAVWPDDNPEWVGHREPELVKGTQVIVRLSPK